MKKLQLATDLSLPVDVVTQTIAILAKRRAGKSYTMRRLAEQLFTAAQQIVIIDPKGDQWGIRFAADGRSPGLPIIILGGERGDVPLEAQGGELVAKLVVEERVSVVLDLSEFRKREVAVFMADFLENLYRMKAREQFRTPMMLVVDEADAIAPQKPQPGEERMLGAIEDIVRRGGQRGVGCTLVTQRSAVLNKNVLTQAQILVALRTIAPQDLKAMKEWIDVHGDESDREVLMASLPSLPVGDAWFWSPGWPTADGILQRVHVLPIETFDSGATPRPGERRVEPKRSADVDLNALKRQMSEVVERKKADDPRELRRQIAELNRQLNLAKSPTSVEKKHLTVEKPLLTDADRALLEKVSLVIGDVGRWFQELEAKADERLQATLRGVLAEYEAARTANVERSSKTIVHQLESKGLQKILAKLEHVGAVPAVSRPIPSVPAVQPRASAAADRSRPASSANGDASASAELGTSGAYRMLVALAAQHPAPCTASKLAILTGIARTGGTFRTYIGKLKTLGWVDGGGDALRITAAGLAAVGEYDPLPKGQKLIEFWQRELGNSGARNIFDTLVSVYPNELSRDDLAARVSMAVDGGTFRTYLGKLRTMELIERKKLKASDVLFD